ncbi:lysozyme inhibitor LprI family protein [uncultured Jannaschia sp.]|uniref:lysozyme inhibitor LprI family protein n=1 Tax=uncultured Jannaschia sp. TaxID=293347 RepID=UPI0026215DAC|nr:lysozyme inhibitor LprI family protein [uncultured Jannaschia sp.]
MRAALLLSLVLAGPVAAQDVLDCAADGLMPGEMVVCAQNGWAEADAVMDETYRLALVQAQVLDEAAAAPEGVTAEDALRASQEVFLTYRDAACAAEALLVAGTRAEDLAGPLCLTRLTERRIADLTVYGAIE